MVTLNILLVEDDALINRAWTLGLSQAGYQVFSVTSLEGAQRLLADRKFDAAIVDVNLQDGNGLDLMKWLKAEKLKLPTIFVSARQDEETAIAALQKGATEFVRKPVGPVELTTRLDRMFKYTKEEPVPSVVFKDLCLNESTQEVLCEGKALKLSPSEYVIFHLLIRHAGSPVSRDRLLEALDLSDKAGDRTIDSHVSRIRKKLKDVGGIDYSISSVWGSGYSLTYLPGAGGTE